MVPRAPRQPHTFPFAEAKSNVESESCSENARSGVAARPFPEKSKHANDKGQALVARAVQFGLRNRRGDAKLALALTLF